MSVADKVTQTLHASLGGALSQLFWYGLLACGVWLFFYILFHARYHHRRVSRGEPKPRQIAREIVFSFRSIAMFGIVTAGVVYSACCGWTQLYGRVEEHGWGWFGLSIGLMPVHPAAFTLFMLWQIAFNVFGHCGYEIYPGWFLRSRAGRLINSVTHHSLHHEKFRANYGLYFNIWDRLMKTNHPDYEQRFESATGNRLDPLDSTQPIQMSR